MRKLACIILAGIFLARIGIAIDERPGESSGSASTSDPVIQHLTLSLDAATGVPFDVRLWAQRVLKGQLKEAGHRWSSIEAQLPEELRDTAQATQLYVLWKLGLYQTFVDEWSKALARPVFANGEAERALASVVQGTLGEVLERESIRFSALAIATLDQLPWSVPFLELKAWASLKSPTRSAEALRHLPAGHRWRAWLVRGVALEAARHGDTRQAISLLRTSLPALETASGAELLSSFSLQLARLYYQAGDLEAAGQWYQKVPTGAPEYLAAREELLWVWLRTGNVSRLRGDLKTLSLDLFDGRFAPEVYVVHAISNLKLCFFPEVEKDFRAFLEQNHSWAVRIEKAEAASMPEPPTSVDWYATLLRRAVERRKAEASALDELIQGSIAASLPSVGRQKHWSEAKDRMAVEVTALEKELGEQYHRQWRNQRRALLEAIRKLRFVKVELLSEARQGVSENPASPRANLARETAIGAVEKEMEAHWSFPFDGVMWPDELFKLRSTAAAQCL